ncbi:hypothetical protein [Porphyrobacter sp. YT40]|uniref:hypothetical protein n=1 Tax=Porphyrobacter sp. YT40 TaxID=2547601 RepID=UPI0011447EEE|nr:hypothetical protein [Porphyrobacter sp. YT40]QDH33555.1 hypothetical protein E2E27_03890 [Porphyrobacter sp. YT40]
MMLLAPSLIGLLLVAATDQQADEFSIINNITVNVTDIGREDLDAARRFADCMSRPRFPTEGEYEGVVWKCSQALPNTTSEQLASLLDQIRHIVHGHPGSEATLEIKKR